MGKIYKIIFKRSELGLFFIIKLYMDLYYFLNDDIKIIKKGISIFIWKYYGGCQSNGECLDCNQLNKINVYFPYIFNC